MTIEGTADKGTLREALDAVERKMYDGFHPNVHPIIHRYAQELRAALSSKDDRPAFPERGPEPLDVERLAEALRNISPHVCTSARLPRFEAERIAAKYAALSKETPA